MIEPDLIGTWLSTGPFGQEKIQIIRPGWVTKLADPSIYIIENNGEHLRIASSDANLPFIRQDQSGTGLIGLWRREIVQGFDHYTEDYHFREDGSYSFHRSLGDSPDLDETGRYEDMGAEVIEEQDWGHMGCGFAGAMAQCRMWDGVTLGTYSIAPDKNSWQFMSDSFTVTYSRVL